MRSDVEGSYEELEKELLEYLAMIDQQNRKAIGKLNSVADSADHNDQEEPIYEYTEPWWDDSAKGLCAVSEANPQKKKSTGGNWESKAKGKGKEKGKCKGRTCHKCGEQGHLARECPALKVKEKGKNGSRRNSGRSTTLLHPEAVELLAARKFERQGQRPRPILWRRRCE